MGGWITLFVPIAHFTWDSTVSTNSWSIDNKIFNSLIPDTSTLKTLVNPPGLCACVGSSDTLMYCQAFGVRGDGAHVVVRGLGGGKDKEKVKEKRAADRGGMYVDWQLTHGTKSYL